MTETKEWILNWFQERNGGILPAGLDENGDATFIESGVDGWIDSFGMIELISAAESKFGVTFTESSFQERNFGTIIGFCNMVEDLLQKS